MLFGNRAAAKLKLQQFEEALADAQEAKRLAPEWVKAFYREGEAFFGMENYGDAAASCAPNPATAYELPPLTGGAFAQLAQVLGGLDAGAREQGDAAAVQ